MWAQIVFKILFINLIIISILNSVTSEWIDQPQFSDEFKVYRAPFTKSNRHKILNDSPFNIAESILINSTKNNVDQSNNMMQVPLFVNVELTTLAYTVVNSNNTIDQHTTTINNVVTVLNNSLNNKSTIINNMNVKNKLILPISEMTLDDCNRTVMETFSDNTNTTENYKLIFSKPQQINKNNLLSFFQYLPIELIKRVHAILLSGTQTSVRGKLELLKTFEKSIINKLESKLIPVFHSIRRKRGSGWDDREDHVGFPSLEGALLAISFLTFAVYLIQLVMMLLRNLANNGVNTTSTVLVNRNKRSDYQFNEDSIRILEYLDGISNN